ncbi:Ribose import permease protein RbsC [[Clostridium] hylemonae DSM 15053]|nr:Ribose import permease protein RbsC [[Clostridium] hylemonae DSM 15053]
MSRIKDFYKKIAEQIVLFAIIIVIIIAMGIASPYFLSVRNAMNIVQYVSTYGIIAIGMTMVILTGGINLSVGGTLAVCLRGGKVHAGGYSMAGCHTRMFDCGRDGRSCEWFCGCGA